MARLTEEQALAVISAGRVATQMPGFTDTLSNEQRQQLATYIFTEPAQQPTWSSVDIGASRLVPYPFGTLGEKPVFTADPMNLFIVVELTDHAATVLDGDKLEPIHRFSTRRALHGGPKYSPDGRYVFFASRDGWISKYDIYNLKVVAEIRAGINTRNLAISSDGNTLIVGNYLPNTVVLLDAKNLELLQVIEVLDAAGKASRVSAVYNAPPRNSFIIALKDVEEVWEISYDKHRAGTAFAPRRIDTQGYLDDFFFDPAYHYLIGTSRDNPNGQVIDLDRGTAVASIELSGMPHLGSAITWDYQGRQIMVTPNFKEGEISVIDMGNWQRIKRIPTQGPGFFTRSHENSRYAWVDVFFGPNKDLVHVIDKQTLEIVKTLQPAPGKTSAHVEFTRDGKYALLSIWDDDGALVVYDGDTLEEVKRIPMKKPSGKYNVYNKTSYSRGTSH
jgi:DNA-binding beta-propeller fold protein YncE